MERPKGKQNGKLPQTDDFNGSDMQDLEAQFYSFVQINQNNDSFR